MKHVYLDYAAATPLDEGILQQMLPYFSEKFHNPSALYTAAREVKHVLEDARQRVASSIGCRSSEIVFTAGGTESDNLAIKGIMDSNPGGHLVVSAVEHDAVCKPAQLYSSSMCPVDEKGTVKLAELESLITDETVLVSVIYASNEVGTVQPIKDVVDIIQKIRSYRRKKGNKTPLYVHTDACQAPLYLDCNVARLGVDLMTLNGGKIHGPKQSAILYIRTGVTLQPLIQGGGQEFGMRSGTEHIASAVGFSLALEKAQKDRRDNAQRIGKLSQWFSAELEKHYGAVLNGHKKLRLPNNVHVTFPECDNERVLFGLDELGIAAATGSACSASSEHASSVLRAMGLSESEARSSIRFSLGSATTEQELAYTIESLRKALPG